MHSPGRSRTTGLSICPEDIATRRLFLVCFVATKHVWNAPHGPKSTAPREQLRNIWRSSYSWPKGVIQKGTENYGIEIAFWARVDIDLEVRILQPLTYRITPQVLWRSFLVNLSRPVALVTIMRRRDRADERNEFQRFWPPARSHPLTTIRRSSKVRAPLVSSLTSYAYRL